MKTTARRNVASLTFIAFLAVVYAVILLVGKRGGDVPMPEVQAVVAADSMVRQTDTVANPLSGNVTSAEKRRKPRKPKAPKRTPKPPAPDNADVFDRPVPRI